MEPTIPRRLRVPGDAVLVEQGLQLRRRLPHVREVRTRLRIQVEPELVGVRGVGREVRHTWNPRQPWLTAQATCAGSEATSALEVVPFGVETIVVSSHSGADSGTRF